MKTRKFAIASIAAAVMMIGTTARAEPLLQLDIAGGTYDATVGVETVFANSNTFTLYAYGLVPGVQGQGPDSGVSTSENFYLSMALVPASSPPGGTFGSFSYKLNGGASTTIGATSEMIYGFAPVEQVASLQGWDSGDLQGHGMFPTYFVEQRFNFVTDQQSNPYNTQTSAGSGPIGGTSGAGMYYAKFEFDISGLQLGYGLHFDLYNEVISTSCTGNPRTCTPITDLDAAKNAPFSHDAQAMVVTSIPEPETYAMLLAGLGLLGFVARRRKQKLAAA